MHRSDLCGPRCQDLPRWLLSIVILTLTITGHVESDGKLFMPGIEYEYQYEAASRTGVLLPALASSGWHIRGQLIVQGEKDSALMQLRSLEISTWNGILNSKKEQYVKINKEAEELYKPFRVTHSNGLVRNVSVQSEPVWATNMKRSIAGILQLDILKAREEIVFNSTEDNHYGQCHVDCVVIPSQKPVRYVRKSIDPQNCRGHPLRFWSNVPKMTCPNNDQNPVLKSSERLYEISELNGNDTYQISFVNATGGIYIQPFQSLGEAQFLFTKQVFRIWRVRNLTEKIDAKEMHSINPQHELPEGDLTQSRNKSNKQQILKSIENLLDRLSSRLENPGLDVKVEHLHNTTISLLLYYMAMLEREDLQMAFTEISGTSYKEETIRNLFLEALPQVGSRDATLFVLDLIQRKQVSDIIAVQLLTHLPFHVRKPDVELLVELQALLNLPETIAAEVQNTAILTYGTLIYKTCLLHCPYEMLDDYVRLYLDKLTESKQYEKKMVWLQGLSNIQLGKVVEFLEPIARGDHSESRHLRFLASLASLPTAPLRPDLIHEVYWPILTNLSEHLELRIAALTLLVVSNPSPNRLITLYWYMQQEPDQHLYNFFYTTLKSMERTNFPCYTQLGTIAAQFTRFLRPPSVKHRLLTGNYLLDYQDTFRHFGAMIQTVIIANPVSNFPVTAFVALNNHGVGMNLNQISLYVKAEGVLEKLAPTQESGEILEVMKRLKIKQEFDRPVHVEIIAQIQGKAVLCLHLNETNIKKGYKFLMDLTEYAYIFQNMAFHINQQRINVPLTMESVQVTDLGTNARLAAEATSIFSMRGNFTYMPIGRNNHVILRSSVHGIEMIETYNPLTDLWYAAERAQSIHAYLPINVTIGLDMKLFFSYIIPAEDITTGITAHVRTSTNIRGPGAQSKLKSVCPDCTVLYTVRKHPERKSKDFTILQATMPELGGQLNLKLFDCESKLTRNRLVAEVVASHRSNYQIWPAVKTGILGFHFLDYFTYVPPGGSCGFAAHIDTYDSKSMEVKLEYLKSGNNSIISLSRRLVGSETILQRWNVVMSYTFLEWFKDSLVVKAIKFESEKEVWEIFFEVERNIPWDQNLLTMIPSPPASVRLSVGWRALQSTSSKSPKFLSQIQLIGEVTDEQIRESKSNVWPYDECREAMKQQGLEEGSLPYIDACYESSKELSTLRKYEMQVSYADLPECLTTWTRKLRAIYELMGGNSSVAPDSTNFTVGAVFPKDFTSASMHLNEDVISLDLNTNFVDNLLLRTRYHRILDGWMTQMFLSTCILEPQLIQTAYGIRVPNPVRYDMNELLLLGHCHSAKPSFAVTYATDFSILNITVYDGSDEIKIVTEAGKPAMYNGSSKLNLERNSRFQSVNSKSVRIGTNMVELFFLDVSLFVHWTPEQVILYYPSYVHEFACGACTAGLPFFYPRQNGVA